MTIGMGTLDMSRDFNRPIETVFAAWSKEHAQSAWGHPGEGWSMRFDRFRFTVGETDICRFGPVGGQEYVNENRYLVIEPARRIVYATLLTHNDQVGFAGTVAITFEPTDNGTEMRLIEQGFYLDGQDDITGHRSGWESMLDALDSYLRR